MLGLRGKQATPVAKFYLEETKMNAIKVEICVCNEYIQYIQKYVIFLCSNTGRQNTIIAGQ